MMDKNILRGYWKEIKGKVRKQWGKVTDDDLERIKGNYDELEGILQKHYGYTNEEVKREIKQFLEKCKTKEKSY